ncbi:hypothetical protein CCZ01_06500 [Helicobacter monodelphidis]|uniref:copper-binding metallochaperone CopP n=1 Tax=Helicobacter sp. 15-1451 TaxID=2004995 RepID=UPI000DCCB996|nr:copper-binding metallochaperone CopP [Helicobacter sp. 15-1451]RAX57342.1 hypothetical protein CCZ01_06500 [Helicobacter sp. 15-1451]
MVETLQVEGMNCQHCVNKIEKFVGELQGVSQINVNLAEKNVQVEFNAPTTPEKIKEAILDAGFDVV